jgi:hypothetical protein
VYDVVSNISFNNTFDIDEAYVRACQQDYVDCSTNSMSELPFKPSPKPIDSQRCDEIDQQSHQEQHNNHEQYQMYRIPCIGSAFRDTKRPTLATGQKQYNNYYQKDRNQFH